MRYAALGAPKSRGRRIARGTALGIAALGTVALMSDRGPDPPSAVVLIVVDTLRADRLAAWGSERPVTPRLDAWLERAVIFEQARAPSPWTLPSFASMYTGLYPARHGAHVVDPLVPNRSFTRVAEDLPRLAEFLETEGWTTAAFVTNRYLSPSFGLAEGFRTYEQAWKPGEKPSRADAAVDAALKWLDDSDDSPFFLALHVFDPHLPYDPPPATRGRFSSDGEIPVKVPITGLKRLRAGEKASTPAERGFVADVYDEDVAFADEHLGRFLDELEARGVLDRALVVFTADHGEELWDHGGFEHGHTMFDELLHVPLAVWTPRVEPRRIATPVTLTDLTPTILDAVGIPVPGGLDGVSLWPAIARGLTPPSRFLLAESPLYVTERRAILDWPWKLVQFPDEHRSELYDLVRDPGETTDVSGERPEVVDRLAAWGAERAAASAEPPSAEAEPDEETLEALRALGYVE